MDNKPKTRYSDAELKEFKDLLESKLEIERAELAFLKSSSESTNNSHDSKIDSALHSEKEVNNYQIDRAQKFIKQLEAALIRIENKTYGICTKTHQLIPKERLRAVPHTTQCMEAKLAA